jgi:hypothetical protein
MRFISPIIYFFLISMAFSAELPEIQTKQALNNLRYLSHDGKFTYFQQNGKLYLSTNYASSIIHSASKTSSFLIFGTDARKKIIIEEDNNFHRNYSSIKIKSIFAAGFGKNEVTPIAKGSFISLNLKDSWINYFNPFEKVIYAKPIMGNNKPIKIKLKNSVNPFFEPSSLMITRDTIIFNDINDTGVMGIFMYSNIEKKFTPLYKGKFPGTNLKFCKVDDSLIIGEFSLDGVSHGSSIYKVPLYSNKGFSSLSQIYTSELDDIGNLVCSKTNLYFIKTINQNKTLNTKTTEVAKIDLKTNKTTILTDLRYVTNIVNMDGTILIPFRDKYLVAEGKSRLNDDKLIKK